MVESAIVNACGAEIAPKIKLAINIGASEIFDIVRKLWFNCRIVYFKINSPFKI